MSRLLRPEEAAERLAIKRTRLYELIQSGELESVVVGRRARRIPDDAIELYIARLRGRDEAAAAV